MQAQRRLNPDMHVAAIELMLCYRYELSATARQTLTINATVYPLGVCLLLDGGIYVRLVGGSWPE